MAYNHLIINNNVYEMVTGICTNDKAHCRLAFEGAVDSDIHYTMPVKDYGGILGRLAPL